MEMGVGIHGEPGHARQPFATADAIIGEFCETIVSDIAVMPGARALLFVNGLGGTPPAELYLAYNAARRFIALVDELYDHNVNLILSAAAPPNEIYRGERLTFEFQRTVSRLIEMQTEEYLAREHRA